MSEMVERVARAIREEIESAHRNHAALRADQLDELMARAAIAAMREPTEAMQVSGVNEECGFAYRYDERDRRSKHCLTPVLLWRAMIDAALADSARETGGET